MHKNIVSIAYVPPEKIDYAWDLAWNIDNGNENLKVVIFPSSQRHSAPPPPIMDYPNRSMIQAFHLNGNDLIMWRELGGLAAGCWRQGGGGRSGFSHILSFAWVTWSQLESGANTKTWHLSFLARRGLEIERAIWMCLRSVGRLEASRGGRYFPFSLPGPLPSPLSRLQAPGQGYNI